MPARRCIHGLHRSESELDESPARHQGGRQSDDGFHFHRRLFVLLEKFRRRPQSVCGQSGGRMRDSIGLQQRRQRQQIRDARSLAGRPPASQASAYQKSTITRMIKKNAPAGPGRPSRSLTGRSYLGASAGRMSSRGRARRDLDCCVQQDLVLAAERQCALSPLPPSSRHRLAPTDSYLSFSSASRLRIRFWLWLLLLRWRRRRSVALRCRPLVADRHEIFSRKEVLYVWTSPVAGAARAVGGPAHRRAR
jgi:hypothetical protein